MIFRRKNFILAIVMLTLALAPLTAHATAYTWSGTTSNAWNLNTNWGGSGFPNAYTDTATIPSAGANRPVVLSTTALLGIASGNALTISGAASGTTSNSLDIASGGLLGMQGGISIGTRRTMTIEGTLRNDSNSTVNPTGAAYNISGSTITMNGATLSNIAGGNGSWNITSGVTISGGTNTFSTPVNANLAINGGTLDLNKSLTATANTASVVLSNAGTVMNINSGGSLILNAAASNPELVVNTGTTVNLNGGTVSGVNATTFSPNFGGAGNINLIADSTLAGKINNDTTNHPGLKPINIGNVGGTIGNLGAHTLNLAAYNGNLQFAVGAGGVLNNFSGTSTIGGISMLGGWITNTGGGTFNLSGGLTGYGNVSGFTNAVGNFTASGGTLTVDAGTGLALGSHSGTGTGLGSGASSTLDLKGTFNYINPASITPNTGTVALNGATLNTYDPTGGVGGTPTTWNETVNSGNVNVTNNSTLIGKFTSAANLTVQSGKTLDASGATFINNGSVTNNGGTASWGNFTNNGVYTSDPSTQTFNNLTVGSTGYLTAVLGDIYQIKGNFTNNSTQNTLWNTTQAALDFITGGTTSHTFALAGADMGQVLAGYTNNFAWGTLDLTGQTLSLLDGNISNTGTALYVGLVNGLTFLGNTVTDIIASNGIDVYYNPSLNLALNGHTFNLTGGGYLLPDPAPVPVPLTLLLVGTGLIPFIRLRKKGLTKHYVTNAR